MNKLIIIAGDLASGKSTLADSLRDEYHFLTLKKDTYKELICDDVGFSTREENLKISHLTLDIMIMTMENAMKCQKDVIIEANFHADELKRIHALIEQYHYQSVIIELQGDLSVLYSRFLARVPNRHRAHLSQNLQSNYPAFEAYIIHNREELKPYPYHLIDMTNLSIDEVYSQSINILKNESIL